jgi:tetratricopeptide (TPR) repeat protein
MDYDRLRELQQKFEENPRRYFAPLANEYRKGGQPKRAIEICREHLEQMPGHMSGQIVYGQALYEAGDFDEAREVFGRALSLDPENLIALRSLGDMSLQAGNTAEARTWYSRLLDADPKDTAVIALISEIDASADATPVAAEIPGIDTDVGDQQIPSEIENPTLEFLDTGVTPEPASASSQPESSQPSAAADAPLGIERHYPIQEASPPESVAQSPVPQGLSIDDLGVPFGGSAAEGLKSALPEDRGPLASPSPAQPPAPQPPAPQPAAPERPAPQPPAPEPTAPERFPARPEASQEAASQSDAISDAFAEADAAQEDFAPQPEPEPAASQHAEKPDEKAFSGASAEPFVNETMAQLYLQQGYKQLALKVYRQLAVARPNDEALRNRIAEIEAEDAAAHPGEFPPARREEPPIEKPAEERPSFDRSPVDSPPSRQPARQRESIEAPTREEPRAEPDGSYARQPSIREFFATLGRRRPPGPTSGAGRGGSRPGNNQPVETSPPLGASPPSASLDTVFAGATVSASDARAASRLAGAFSQGSGASRTPPTPPMPTPRVNTRVQAQESEEDVAKFRAWLDGLTGE